ncbi:MAG: hypothetical protein ACKVH0_10645 [Alphaproteobacteria bacterium]
MIFWFLIGLVVLGAVLGFARWYANAPTGQAGRAFKIVLVVVIGIVALLLMTRVGVSPLIGLLIALGPVLLGLRGALRRARAAQGPTPGGASTVMSDWFEMSLAHDTGAIGGVVRRGPHAGQELDDLDEATLDALALAAADDANSTRLLAAYMARRFGRPDPGEPETGHQESSGSMSVSEALAVLGLEAEGLDPDNINQAYKHLISATHPDRGGSAYLAAKINEARKVLIDSL